ncbi:glycosyltransferase [Vibrio breoganii]|uniref:glycosyltransferase n=1 Tax=Vibrio breoganii TaxID=553239 RepID=UPI000C862D6B|nr:glycosyltransferase [Vibrio breoganii]PMM79284.1 sugar transferase [Vibrio breoganii]
MKSKLSPVVLFVYARPEHTQKTIAALQLNPEAIETDLIIYSDAPKNDSDRTYVGKVRSIIRHIDGFKSVKVISREENLGLAENIIDGVSKITKIYGRVIVLEDDIVTSTSFLKFMNNSLTKYENTKEVWHVSGWNYPLKVSDTMDAYLWRGMNCWGWATWQDRWDKFDKDPERLLRTWDKRKIRRFNIDGTYNFWSQVINNRNKKINTWAVFWYASIFENQGLCLNPVRTYTTNIGLDGSGENCGVNDIISLELNTSIEVNFPKNIKENEVIVDRVKSFLKRNKASFFKRVIYKLRYLK